MHIRIKQFNTAALFVLASVVSICTAFIPTTAFAAINPASDRDKTLAYSYYKIIDTCSSSLDRDIDTGNSTNPSSWVNDSLFGNANKELKTGFLINDEGKDDCKELMGKALSFLQIQPVDFLKGVNYSLNSDGTKYSRSSNQKSDFTSYISRTVPGASQETPTIKYALDYAELTTGCKAQKVGSLATVDEATSKQATSNTNGYLTINTANNDGSTTVYVYKSGQEAINNHGTPGEDLNNVSYLCTAVANNVSAAASGIAKSASDNLYRTLANTISSSLNGLKAAECNAQPNNALRTECQQGWQDSFNQCFAVYENATRLSAKNGPNGNTSEFSKPTDKQLDALSLCIADKTGAPALEVGAAVKAANTSFQTPTNAVVDDNSTPNDETSCTINGIGWILCPVMDFMGGITDASYSVVATMLTINPSMFDQSKSEGVATFSAWSAMRNFANVAFVIVFLIIIFSQISSLGVSNYGIKKLLPKLIVAAILVNISYYLCAIAVDLSNIIGSSVKSIFDSTAGSVTAANKATLLDKTFSGAEGGNLFATLTGSLIAVAGISTIALYSGLSILLPVLISALVAIVTVVAVLIMRQALIILLIVISPLAFVALLLPNTEGLFKKWRSLLTTLLLMFPIIAAIFGASALAGKIIMSSDGNILVQIMGAGITIIPLFITPLVMRAAGGVLNRFGGFINNPNKGPIDSLRKRAGSFRDARQNTRRANALTGGRVFGGGQFRRETRRNYRNKAAEDAAKAGDAAFSMTDSAASRYANSSTQSQLATSAVNAARSNATVAGITAGTVNPGDALGNAAAIPEIAKALAEQQAKALSESLSSSLKTLAIEVAKQKAVGNDTDAFLVARARNKSLPQIEQDAAIHQLATTGRDKAIRDLQGDSSINQSTVQEAISAGASSLIGKAPDLVKGAKAGFGDVTGEQLAGYSKSTAEAYITHMEGLSGADFTTATARFEKAIDDIKADSSLQAKFSGDTGLEIIKTLGSAPKAAASIGTAATLNIDSVSGKIT